MEHIVGMVVLFETCAVFRNTSYVVVVMGMKVWRGEERRRPKTCFVHVQK